MKPLYDANQNELVNKLDVYLSCFVVDLINHINTNNLKHAREENKNYPNHYCIIDESFPFDLELYFLRNLEIEEQKDEHDYLSSLLESFMDAEENIFTFIQILKELDDLRLKDDNIYECIFHKKISIIKMVSITNKYFH